MLDSTVELQANRSIALRAPVDVSVIRVLVQRALASACGKYSLEVILNRSGRAQFCFKLAKKFEAANSSDTAPIDAQQCRCKCRRFDIDLDTSRHVTDRA
jgi:hypothetical protein